jgi:hypothetical protein
MTTFKKAMVLGNLEFADQTIEKGKIVKVITASESSLYKKVSLVPSIKKEIDTGHVLIITSLNNMGGEQQEWLVISQYLKIIKENESVSSFAEWG